MSEAATQSLTLSRLAEVLTELSGLKYRLAQMEKPTSLVSDRLAGVQARLTALESSIGRTEVGIARLVELLEPPPPPVASAARPLASIKLDNVAGRWRFVVYHEGREEPVAMGSAKTRAEAISQACDAAG